MSTFWKIILVTLFFPFLQALAWGREPETTAATNGRMDIFIAVVIVVLVGVLAYLLWMRWLIAKVTTKAVERVLQHMKLQVERNSARRRQVLQEGDYLLEHDEGGDRDAREREDFSLTAASRR